MSDLLRRLWHRYQAGKVLGHRNVIRCGRCSDGQGCDVWHHRKYHT